MKGRGFFERLLREAGGRRIAFRRSPGGFMKNFLGLRTAGSISLKSRGLLQDRRASVRRSGPSARDPTAGVLLDDADGLPGRERDQVSVVKDGSTKLPHKIASKM